MLMLVIQVSRRVTQHARNTLVITSGLLEALDELEHRNNF